MKDDKSAMFSLWILPSLKDAVQRVATTPIASVAFTKTDKANNNYNNVFVRVNRRQSADVKTRH